MRFVQVIYAHARDVLAPGAGKEFLRNAGMTTIAFGLSSACTFLANVLAARWLGRDLYGTYELMFRASQLIGIFCLFGMTTATTKFLASEEGKEGQILRTATSIVLIQTVVALFLMFLLREQIQEVAHLPSGVIELALVFTTGYVLKELVSGMLRGLHRFIWLARVNGVYGGVVLLSLAVITLFVDVPLYEW
ncbi:MAG: hypothetical protein KC653_03330, partial [Candidatus Andersenbacteria bacterium]|nr:hypothetical protein [Candidatus Andersenbacteria bacterium]